MGIFEKFADILISDLSDFIDETADPKERVGQVISDIRKELDENTKKYEKAKTAKKLARKKYEDALKASENWKNKAKLALSQDNRELAEKALAKKIAADKDAKDCKKIYKFISGQTDEISEYVAELNAKLSEAKTKETLFSARSKISDIKKEFIKSFSDIDFSDAVEELKNLRDEIKCKDTNNSGEKADECKFEEKLGDALSELQSEIESGIEDFVSEIDDESISEEIDSAISELMSELDSDSSDEEDDE